MLDLTIRLRDARDVSAAAREASAKLSAEDWQLLVDFAQACCLAHEMRDPNRLIVIETREVARPAHVPASVSKLPTVL